TVVERTPRPRPVSEARATEAEAPATAKAPEAEPTAPPKTASSSRAKVKRARTAKNGKASAREGAEAAPAPKAAKARKSVAKSRSRSKKKAERAGGEATQDASVIVARLVEALRAHPRHEALVSAGKQKDQLVRSLIPLYLARAVESGMEVTSGTTSRFWSELGVTYAAPNAAKALRLHSGYAQDTKKGKAITPRGIQYVEEALERVGAQGSR
ncbi:hypothetical protein ACLESO_44055, partial [Pyxidicoccus sp. 3LG]